MRQLYYISGNNHTFLSIASLPGPRDVWMCHRPALHSHIYGRILPKNWSSASQTQENFLIFMSQLYAMKFLQRKMKVCQKSPEGGPCLE